MTCKQAKALVKSRLGEKRYRHTINVKKMAVALAERWGADPEKAELAALLHDSAKELPRDELLQIFADNAIIADNAARRPAPIWHGIAAAILCQTQWGVTDPEVLSAIRCHTTGKPEMTLLDKILYIADYIEPNRAELPDMSEARRLAFEDIDECLYLLLRDSLVYLQTKGLPVDPATEKTYNYYKKYLGKKEEESL